MDYKYNIRFDLTCLNLNLFLGNGDDSRTTEIFIAMPGASQEQLDYFGENSWETPFAVLQGDANVLSKIYSDYGDMPP